MSIETGDLGGLLGRVGAALDGLLADLPEDPVGRRARWLAALERPLPDEGVGAESVLDELLGVVVPNGARLTEPGFWGFITTAPTSVPAAAAAAASIAGAQRYTITAFNLLEELSLEWLGSLCGLEPHMKGLYSSGGSTANLVALGAARQWAFERAGIDPAADGLGGLRPAVYASTEVHHTVQRSAGVLGLGRGSVRPVPTDGRQRADVGALREMISADAARGITPVAVVGTVGTTNTGAIDPLRTLGEIAAEHGAWFHVDGAYGLPGILDERVAPRYDGLDLADSVIVDPHKWLAAPIGVAATFVRDRKILHRAFTQEPADYLEGSFAEDDVRTSLDSIGIPYGDFGVELSAPSRGVVVWSLIREQGVEGIRARIRRDNDFAGYVARRATEDPRLESLTEPELSIACIRHTGPAADLDAHNRSLLRRLVRETRFLPSATSVGGRFAIRPCFINPRTEQHHVEGFVDAVIRIGDGLAREA